MTVKLVYYSLIARLVSLLSLISAANEEFLLTKLKVFGSIFYLNGWAKVPNITVR